MPELSQKCIPSPAPPPVPPGTPPIPPEGPSEPPALPPGAWEDIVVFRQVFLQYFETQPEIVEALRLLGRFLFDLVLEQCGSWPPSGDSSIVEQIRAGADDLRFLESFFGDVGAAHRVSGLSEADARLSRRAESWAAQARKLATVIDKALNAADIT